MWLDELPEPVLGVLLGPLPTALPLALLGALLPVTLALRSRALPEGMIVVLEAEEIKAETDSVETARFEIIELTSAGADSRRVLAAPVVLAPGSILIENFFGEGSVRHLVYNATISVSFGNRFSGGSKLRRKFYNTLNILK